jgi:hypothetical protein
VVTPSDERAFCVHGEPIKLCPYCTEVEPILQVVTDGTASLAELLDGVEATLRRYVIMGGNARTIVATWVAHVFAFGAAEFTPYLAVTSATKRSGKSRLLEVLEVILGPSRSVSTSNISAASLFRLIDANPGLAVLVDEVDRIPKEKAEELWGLINSGWRITGKAHRQTGAKMTELATFSTFSPKVLAGIGTLPDTVADRAITIRMERRLQSETVERLRLRRAADEVAGLRADLERWADESTIARLSEATPTFPAAMSNDRLMDVAEPLFAIADEAGGAWPERVRTAVIALDADAEKVADEELGTLALRHVLESFTERGVDRMFTDELLADLVRRDDGPWAEWWGEKVDAGKPIGPARRLRQLLERFDGVEPKQLRMDGRAGVRGYELWPIKQAAGRYLPSPSATPVTSATPLASTVASGADVADTQGGGAQGTSVGQPGVEAAPIGCEQSGLHFCIGVEPYGWRQHDTGGAA